MKDNKTLVISNLKKWLCAACLSLVYIQIYAQGGTHAHPTGMLFDDTAYQHVPAKAQLTRSMYDNLPPRASLKRYCPEARDQGESSTCVGWSSAWAARTILWAEENGFTDTRYITARAFSPSFIYRLIAQDNDCKRGSKIEDALNALKTTGAVPFASFHDACPASVPRTLVAMAAGNRIETYNRLYSTDAAPKLKIESVKKSLSEGYPVLIGMSCPYSFQQCKALWAPAESPLGTYDGHAMCVVGYDDGQYGGAFEIMNSWGKDWGDSGFVWVRYNDFAAFTRYAFEMVGHIGQQQANDRQVAFSGKLRLLGSDGKLMPAHWRDAPVAADGTPAIAEAGSYTLQGGYASGTLFNLYVQNNAPAYVYALASDSTGKVNVLFPTGHTSALLNYRNSEIAIPAEGYYIGIDSTPGEDYLCVLYSHEALDMDKLRAQIETGKGSFRQRVYQALSGKIPTADKMHFDKDRIQFSCSSAQAVLPVLINIKHP